MKTKRLEMVFGGIYRFENDETVVVVDLTQPIPEIKWVGELNETLLVEITEEVLEIRKELMKHYLN